MKISICRKWWSEVRGRMRYLLQKCLNLQGLSGTFNFNIDEDCFGGAMLNNNLIRILITDLFEVCYVWLRICSKHGVNIKAGFLFL